MATLSIQDITDAGLDVTLSAADAGGDTFNQGARSDVFLYVDNGAASSVTVTVTAANTSKEVPNWGEMTVSDVSVAVPAGEFRLIGPFPLGPFTSTPDVSYSSATSVTVAAVRLPR